MSRNPKRSDSVYNARRRFIRAAERALNKSYDAVGAEKSRYREMAREYTAKAAELYQGKVKGKVSGVMQKLSDALGVNLREFASSEKPTKREQQRQSRLIKESEKVTEYVKNDNGGYRKKTSIETREEAANAILNSPIGSRIYAGLVDVWAKPTIEDGEIKMRRTREDINNAIMEHFGVSSMMDVIEMLEEKVDLYADPQSIERYDTVSLTIANSLYE